MSDTPVFSDQALQANLEEAETALAAARQERDELNREIVQVLVPALRRARALARVIHPVTRKRKPKQDRLLAE